MLDSTTSATAKYTSLVDAIECGYCLIRVVCNDEGRPVSYRFLETNARFEENTGLAGVIGRDVLELVPDLEPFWIEVYGKVAITRDAHCFEHYSGAMGRSFDVHAFPVGDPDGLLVGLLFNDVTERRRSEGHQAFLASVAADFERLGTVEQVMSAVGARLGAHLEIAGCAFCEVDEEAGTIESSFGWGRDGEPNLIRTYRICEYLSEEFAAQSRARQPVLVSDTGDDPRTDARAYEALNIRSFMTVPRHLHGRWTHYLAATDSRPRQWRADEVRLFEAFATLVFSRLERAQAEAELRSSEARFRAMADAVPQIVWITDPQGRVEFFNRHWSDYTGIAYLPATASEVAAAVVHPEDAGPTMAGFAAALESGTTYQVEHRIRSAAGTYRWFLVRAEPERRPGTGEIVRWIGASVDIHDRKVAEHALSDADRRKDQFLATLAHELRNPLAPLRTGLAVLDLNPARETAERTRAAMNRQLTHMVRLIDELLDISRITNNKIQLKRQQVDVRSLIDEAIDANLPAIDGGHHRLLVSLPAEPMVLDADPTRLVQVLGNLLNNAAKYTPEGGCIEVSAQVVDAVAVIRVRDTGIGMEPAALEKVFDIFSQVESSMARAQGGLGIGLSLVHRLIALHGGSVTARSDGLGRGSEFIVSLPLARPAGNQAGGTASGHLPSLSPMQILVVDGNVDAARTMRDELELGGHCVSIAHSAADALASLRAVPPRVVFLDIGLPTADGHDVAQQLRRDAAGGRITLVAVTGQGVDSGHARALDSGFDYHLTKPVDMQRVARVLGALA